MTTDRASSPPAGLLNHVISEIRERVIDNETMARDTAEETFRAIETGGYRVVPAGPTTECICPRCGVRHGLQTEVPDDQRF